MKNNLKFKVRLWLAIVLLGIAVALTVLKYTSVVWDGFSLSYVFTLAYQLSLVIFIGYCLIRGTSMQNPRGLYLAAVAMLLPATLLSAIRSFTSVGDVWDMCFVVAAWSEAGLYMCIFADGFSKKQFKSIQRIEWLLLLVTIVFYAICGVVVLYANFHGISGLLGIPGIFRTMISCVYWYITPMLIGTAVLLILPYSRTLLLAQKGDIESQLLRLKQEYENGCMSKKTYAKLQEELLQKL